MYNSNIPGDRELPSTGKLFKSTIMAAITACVLLVTVVMPAEYGIDPTGIGNAIGLKRMGEIKMSLAAEAAADEQAAAQTAAAPLAEVPVAAPAPVAAPVAVAAVQPVQETPPAPQEPSAALRSDEMQVTLAPDEGTEIKVSLSEGQKVEYSWTTDGGKANFDVHGDSKVLKIDYHNYEKGADQTKSGEIIAAFDGSHGWFWRNRTKEPLTVTLKATGEYTDIKHMK